MVNTLLTYAAAFDETTTCVGVARVGSDTQQIKAGSLKQMTSVDLGGPLHSLVIAGHMHPLEIDMLKIYADIDSLLEQEIK